MLNSLTEPAYLADMRARLKITDTAGSELQLVNDRLKEAIQLKKERGENAKALRRSFLEERAESEAHKHNGSAEKAIRAILRHEEQRELFERIRSVVSDERSGALSKLLIPSLRFGKQAPPSDRAGQTWRRLIRRKFASGEPHYKRYSHGYSLDVPLTQLKYYLRSNIAHYWMHLIKLRVVRNFYIISIL